MSDDDTIPDYYAILQVNPAAEPEIIEAAYRRLMQKYHPDTISPELRSDPTILSRVRSINVAYDVLSDPIQRAAYDAIFLHQTPYPEQEINPDIETRILLVGCERTKQKYRMLLGRKKKSSSFFRVLGFEAIDVSPAALESHPQVAALPAPSQPVNLLNRLLGQLKDRKRESPKTNSPQPKFPSADLINDIFDESNSLNFAEIDFSGQRCPACNAAHTDPDGAIYTWIRCSGCGRICCTGAIQSTVLGGISHYPWCGRLGRITAHVRLGDKVDMPVKGEIGRSSLAKTKHPRLSKPGRGSLPDK